MVERSNKILIIEDNYKLAKKLGNYLHRFGYETTSIGTKRAGIKPRLYKFLENNPRKNSLVILGDIPGKYFETAVGIINNFCATAVYFHYEENSFYVNRAKQEKISTFRHNELNGLVKFVEEYFAGAKTTKK